MTSPVERRQAWSRIVGVERRSAPFQSLEGRPLPDPTRLEDEEFAEAQKRRATSALGRAIVLNALDLRHRIARVVADLEDAKPRERRAGASTTSTTTGTSIRPSPV